MNNGVRKWSAQVRVQGLKNARLECADERASAQVKRAIERANAHWGAHTCA